MFLHPRDLYPSGFDSHTGGSADSLSHQGMHDGPPILAKEARLHARMRKAVGRFSGSNSNLQEPLGWELGPIGKNMLPEIYQLGPK